MKEGTILEKIFNTFVIILVVFGISYFLIRSFIGLNNIKKYESNSKFNEEVIKMDNESLNEETYSKFKNLSKKYNFFRKEKNTLVFFD